MKRSKTRNIIIGVLVILILWFVAHTVFVTIDGLNDELNTTDVAVVLGNKVEINGKPSKRLQGRLDKAVELYKGNYFNYIIVSGGFGKEGYDEAIVMKNYLVEKGISEDKILIDSVGYNSLMTAKNTKLIMNDMNFDSVTIITQFYHITRTKFTFQREGIENIYSAHSNYYELRDLYSLFREFFAYYKYLIIR